MKAFLSVGEILKPHGLDGTLKVRIDADSGEVFTNNQTFYLSPDGTKEVHILKASFFGKFAYITLENVDHIDKAEKLRGERLYIHRSQLPKLEENQYYIVDLIDSLVVDDANQTIGSIVDVKQYASNDVYIIKAVDGKGIMIPALKDLIISFDADKKKLTLLRKRFNEVAVIDD
ncbi:MAG: ribosome maturation factor RimM [Christensenellales bacterium]|jgi:16S rRNA processing protein RimM|nr:16S rRNA processing protein RimM [Clostridiales bacterium]